MIGNVREHTGIYMDRQNIKLMEHYTSGRNVQRTDIISKGMYKERYFKLILDQFRAQVYAKPVYCPVILRTVVFSIQE